MRGGTSVNQGPAHAGRLKAWEGVAFAIVFGIMTGFVVAAVISAVKHSGGSQPPARHGHTRTPAVHRLTGHTPHQTGNPGGSTSGVSDLSLKERLTLAMRPIVTADSGNVAVGVVDLTTGARVLYHRREHFHTASIVKADILATLLLQHQRSGTPLSEEESELATTMIENSNDDAATDLWNTVGGADGIEEANETLGLRHTWPGQGGYWGLTSTTVVDQLHLLRDLVSVRSALTDASRDYELGLMRDVEADQRWGVPVVAAPDSDPAVKNGWLPDPDLWVINSIGVVKRAGQTLLIAVLSNDHQSEEAGIDEVQAAAKAAASIVTAGTGG